MNLKINPQIFEKFPNLILGVLVLRNLDNTGHDPKIEKLLRSAESEVRAIPNIEPVNSYSKIESWREAHRVFGSSPKKAAPSVQSIVRRVVKGGQLPTINKLVDLYNYISVKYVLPAGGEDLDKCEGDIELTFADGTENFIELGSTEERLPESGEIIYKDSVGAICRKWNWREAERTKLTDGTKNALLVLEALPPLSREELKKALKELQELVAAHCGGEITPYFLDKEALEIVINNL